MLAQLVTRRSVSGCFIVRVRAGNGLRRLCSESITLSQQNIECGNTKKKKRIVFLGTPSVAVNTLSRLLEASRDDNSLFEIVAVVTKHVESVGHKAAKLHPRDPQPAMREICDLHSLPQFSPVKANDADFLEEISALEPDLCITAAYGNYLPPSFLKLPRFGTLNIHPSLLPRYRGAAPVQRSLESGDVVTGVSVLYSVKQMDAGPLLSQTTLTLQGNEKSSEVLDELFRIGVEDLIRRLPEVFKDTNELIYHKELGKFSDVHANQLSRLPHVQLQHEAAATEAPKLKAEEAKIDFGSMSAIEIHNRCRGFSEWPGVWAHFCMVSPGPEETRSPKIKIKLITTKIVDDIIDSSAADVEHNMICNKPNDEVTYHLHPGECEGRKRDGSFIVRCGGGGLLAIEELQPAGKKVMKAKNFHNGLRSRKLVFVR